MLKIKNKRFTKEYNLSDEVYEIVKHDHDSPGFASYKRLFPLGMKVRLISGVNLSEIPGYHWLNGWVSFCPVNAKYATWGLCSKSCLQLCNYPQWSVNLEEALNAEN